MPSLETENSFGQYREAVLRQCRHDGGSTRDRRQAAITVPNGQHSAVEQRANFGQRKDEVIQVRR